MADAARSFSTTEARQQDLLQYALDAHGYIYSCTVIIFHPQICARSLNQVAGNANVKRASLGFPLAQSLGDWVNAAASVQPQGRQHRRSRTRNLKADDFWSAVRQSELAAGNFEGKLELQGPPNPRYLGRGD